MTRQRHAKYFTFIGLYMFIGLHLRHALLVLSVVLLLGICGELSATHCEGGGAACHVTGDCTIGAGGEAPREHNHTSGEGSGCSARKGQHGSCTGDGGQGHWFLTCRNWLMASFCNATQWCNGTPTSVLNVDAARGDVDTLFYRKGNSCFRKTCGQGTSQINCGGAGLG